MSENPVIDEFGTQRWLKDNKYHREDGPALIRHDGTERWFIDGKKHRVGGPASTKADGTKYWYQHGRLHRTDGPAIISSDNRLWWYIQNIRIHSWSTYQQLAKLSDEELAFLILKYGDIS